MLISTSHSHLVGDLRSPVQIPPEHWSPSAPIGPGPFGRFKPTNQAPLQVHLLGTPVPVVPSPAAAGAGGGVSLRGGSLWRCCVRRSLCRGAGSRGNANEADPGRRTEEPGGDGREGARAP
ncbi:hypothetical protein P7K49_013571 [Saguinus oedipus]|uniref:Uncharacterized protein n=1 Tax=Saguinus oedipus TaxID=9490 RepID=A0ABQ9VGH8_SAGOE|nr:hypothetical protein P7K49_013571 [Saguinus oedipus]